jgi:deoxycytidine triphosphate deaminase
MTILSRQSIMKRCVDGDMVRRQDEKPLKFEPVSIDLHLAEVELDDGIVREGSVTLKPGIFCLGSTIEKFNMPYDVVGFIVGKSTYAREALQVEAAGLVDPGFRGFITFELKNLHHEDCIVLGIGESIGQVYFMPVDEPVDVPYGLGNHYQDQVGVTRSYRKQRLSNAR